MPISLSRHASVLAAPRRAARFEADESGWERQLRTIAARERAAAVPAALRFAPARTTLALAARVSSEDSLLLPRTLPAFTGAEPEELVCGKCSGVLGAGISIRTLRRTHPEGDRLVVRCPCGGLNLLAPPRK